MKGKWKEKFIKETKHFNIKSTEKGKENVQ